MKGEVSIVMLIFGGGYPLKMSHRTFSTSTRRLDETKRSTDIMFFQNFLNKKAGAPYTSYDLPKGLENS